MLHGGFGWARTDSKDRAFCFGTNEREEEGRGEVGAGGVALACEECEQKWPRDGGFGWRSKKMAQCQRAGWSQGKLLSSRLS